MANLFAQRRFFGDLADAGAVRLAADGFPARDDLDSEESVDIARPPCRWRSGMIGRMGDLS